MFNLIPPIPSIDSLVDGAMNKGEEFLQGGDPTEIPDLTRFMRTVENRDLARANMFIVRFGDFRSTIFNDGVFDTDVPIVPDGTGQNTSDDLFSGTSYTWKRLQDVALGTAHKILSPKMKKMFGAYDPSLIRMIPGAGEILDGFLGLDYDMNKDFALMVKAVSIPSSTIETQINRTDKLPWHEARGRTFGNIVMTFYCSPSYEERSMMLSWQNAITDPKTGRWGFYNSYARDIDVITLDRHGVKQSLSHSTGCFPIEVGEVQLDFENNSQVATFQVTFAVSTSTHIPNKGQENAIDSIESIIRRTTGVYKSIKN